MWVLEMLQILEKKITNLICKMDTTIRTSYHIEILTVLLMPMDSHEAIMVFSLWDICGTSNALEPS